MSFAIFWTSVPTSPAGRSSTSAWMPIRRCKSCRLMICGLDEFGDLPQRHHAHLPVGAQLVRRKPVDDKRPHGAAASDVR
jgi:hypothetical protein